MISLSEFIIIVKLLFPIMAITNFDRHELF